MDQSRHPALLCLSGLFSFVFGFVGMLVYDRDSLRQAGMFQGYNSVTCAVVVLQVGSQPPLPRLLLSLN